MDESDEINAALAKLSQESVLRAFVEAVNKLNHAHTQDQAEDAYCSAMPFLWFSTYERLTEPQQAILKEALCRVESEYGSMDHLFEMPLDETATEN